MSQSNRSGESVTPMPSSEDFKDFSELAQDIVLALVNEPAACQVDVEGTTRGMLVHLSGPRSEVAMVVGKQGATAAALHRVLFAMARRAGFHGTLNLEWTPTDA